jgi:tRNA dimethylallyltransferase
VRARLAALPLGELQARLGRADPASAARIGRADRYRLVRALELVELAGRTPTELQASLEASHRGAPDPRLELWIVDRAPAELEARLSARARAMIDQGLVDEVRRVRASFPAARALGAVGYLQVCDYLDGRKPSGRRVAPGVEGLVDEIRLATRQLVKKQRTWFRNLHARLGGAAHWLDLTGTD